MKTTGREMQLTRQIGEHLVAAELGRRGYLAAPFAGNVPMFDLLAADARGYSIPVQVKAINGGSWQFSADKFLEIISENGAQEVRGRIALLNPELVCIFIVLKGLGSDEFYIFQLRDLQEHCALVYKPRGPGSKNPTSFHCAVSPKEFERFRDKWNLLERAFAAMHLK